MYFSDDAMLFAYGDIERNLCTIATWEDLKKELKSQFYPENVEYLARKSFQRLKHTGTII